MNNRNCSKYSSDPEARFGIKGKEKIWVGFKRHVCVDMKQGFITRSSIRPANEPDHRGLEDVCPASGMVLADKAYGIEAAKALIRSRNCHPGVIHKNNMKCKRSARIERLKRGSPNYGCRMKGHFLRLIIEPDTSESRS